MQINKPFGGYTSLNYVDALDPSGQNSMLNGDAERKMQKIFAPREVEKPINIFNITTIMTFLFVIYYFLIKQSED